MTPDADEYNSKYLHVAMNESLLRKYFACTPRDLSTWYASTSFTHGNLDLNLYFFQIFHTQKKQGMLLPIILLDTDARVPWRAKILDANNAPKKN